MTNALFSIQPFVHNGMWVFDDEARGLDKEPFVMGADTLLDKVYHAYSRPEGDWDVNSIVFSATPLPEADITMRATSTDPTKTDGTYWVVENATDKLDACVDHELWLCPALYAFFSDGAPERIYIKIDTSARDHPYASREHAQQGR